MKLYRLLEEKLLETIKISRKESDSSKDAEISNNSLPEISWDAKYVK